MTTLSSTPPAARPTSTRDDEAPARETAEGVFNSARSNLSALAERNNPDNGVRGYAGGYELSSYERTLTGRASLMGVEHDNASFRALNLQVTAEPRGLVGRVNTYEAALRTEHVNADLRGPQAEFAYGVVRDAEGGVSTGLSLGASLHEVRATAMTANPDRAGDVTLTGEARFGHKWGGSLTNTDVDGDGRREYGFKADLGFFSLGFGFENPFE